MTSTRPSELLNWVEPEEWGPRLEFDISIMAEYTAEQQRQLKGKGKKEF